VGLGSAGSKIALTLARMGAKEFYLVDHDILLPENLVRHALDWQTVGEHKVDATAFALRQLAANMQVSVSRAHLAGQESNALVNNVLQRVGECDLIIDATASAHVFNLLAAVSDAAKKPLIWLEIFAGGIGGLIARSRHGIDPNPQTMRAIFLGYCAEQPVPSQQAERDYGAQDADGNVLTASDADVSIIAHHAARLAADTVLAPNASHYPFSMYLIGLAEAWVFEAPFATIPIDTGSFAEMAPTRVDVEPFGCDNTQFLVALLERQTHAPPAPL
jgi:molybdopterin/thiamine biosynthesis adenylyltransferase